MADVQMAAGASITACAALCAARMGCGSYAVRYNGTAEPGACLMCMNTTAMGAGRPACSTPGAETNTTGLPAVKPCNASGACLVCGSRTRKQELEATRSAAAMAFFSRRCDFYDPGGDHAAGYTFTKTRSMTLYAGGAHLLGPITASVPLHITGPVRTARRISYTGPRLAVTGALTTDDEVAIVVTETTTSITTGTVTAGRFALAAAHVQGSIDIDTCGRPPNATKNGAVILQSLANDRLATHFGRGCRVVDLSRLLNIYGQDYEVIFYHGDLSDVVARDVRMVAAYSAAVAAGTLVLLALAFGDTVYKMFTVRKKEKFKVS